jgi:predicted small lipoprotein YifL
MKFVMRKSSVAVPSSPLRQQGLCRVAAAVLALVLVGCGQKGPLTLPPAASTSAASAPSTVK